MLSPLVKYTKRTKNIYMLREDSILLMLYTSGGHPSNAYRLQHLPLLVLANGNPKQYQHRSIIRTNTCRIE
jgi:hypothetical protein